MTASKPKKKHEPCPSGLPHHWVIGSERDVEGYFPAECRGCGGQRRFSGASDPDYMGAYGQYGGGEMRVNVKAMHTRGNNDTSEGLASDRRDDF